MDCITKPEPFEVITKPDVLADVRPVPPLLTAIVVAFQVPVVNVPTAVRFVKLSIAASNVFSVVASIASTF